MRSFNMKNFTAAARARLMRIAFAGERREREAEEKEYTAKMNDMASRIDAMKQFKGKAAMRNNILSKMRYLRMYKDSSLHNAKLFLKEAEEIYAEAVRLDGAGEVEA